MSPEASTASPQAAGHFKTDICGQLTPGPSCRSSASGVALKVFASTAFLVKDITEPPLRVAAPHQALISRPLFQRLTQVQWSNPRRRAELSTYWMGSSSDNKDASFRASTYPRT